MLDNSAMSMVGAVSVDLRLARIFHVSAQGVVDLDAGVIPDHVELELPYVIAPGGYVLAQTIETVREGNRYACILSPRSRAFRIGLSIETNLWGPYYHGAITFGISNHASYPIRLTKGLSLVQLSFVSIDGDTVPVEHLYQGGKVL